MSNQDVPAYQRLLAATDAIGEVGRAARGQLHAALEHALGGMLAALDLPEGGIYLARGAVTPVNVASIFDSLTSSTVIGPIPTAISS